MKTKVLLVGIVFVALTLVSCKKDWNCACVYNGGATVSYDFIGLTKKDAEKECDDQEKVKVGGSTYTSSNINCSISEK